MPLAVTKSITHFPASESTVTYPDGTSAKTVTPAYDTQSESFVDYDPIVPIYFDPGVRALDSSGAVIWLRDTDGALFRNGVRLGNNAAARALSYGGDTFCKGHDGRWWQWTQSNTWLLLTGARELDPSIFN